jgi:hypothetical protein
MSPQRRRRRTRPEILDELKKAVEHDRDQFLPLSVKIPAWLKLRLYEQQGDDLNVSVTVSAWIREKVGGAPEVTPQQLPPPRRRHAS